MKIEHIALYVNDLEKTRSLENYTGYDHTEIYPGGIYGVVNNKAGLSTEERLDDMGIKLETAKQDIEALKENGGNGGAPGTYASVFAMAKISAEKITDDEQALKVADLVPIIGDENMIQEMPEEFNKVLEVQKSWKK